MTLFRMLLLLPNVTLRLALFITCYIGLVIPSIAQQEEPAINGTLALKELQAFVNAFTQIRNTYVEEVDEKHY